jgi:hypothetical protein
LLFWSLRGAPVVRASAGVLETISSWEPEADELRTLLALCLPANQQELVLALTFGPSWQPNPNWTLKIPSVVSKVIVSLADGRTIGSAQHRGAPGDDWTLETHYLTPHKITNATTADLLPVAVVERGPDEWERAVQDPGVFRGWFWIGRGDGDCTANMGYGSKHFQCPPGQDKYPEHVCYFGKQGISAARCTRRPTKDELTFVIRSSARGCDQVYMCE